MYLYCYLTNTCKLNSRCRLHTKVHFVSRKGAKRYSQTQMPRKFISSNSGSEWWKRRCSSRRNLRKWQRAGLSTLSSGSIARTPDVRGRTWVACRGPFGLFHTDSCEDLPLAFLAHCEFGYSQWAIDHNTTLEIICQVTAITV